MTHPSVSKPEKNTSRPWLKRYHQARRERTVRLVKATVDQLLTEGQTVTLEAICTRSSEVDPEGKGIKKAAIIGNAEAHAYYCKHSSTYQRGLGYQQRKGRNKRLLAQPSRIDADRDVDRVRQRYLLQPKTDLVERLLAVERGYAHAQEQLTQLQFEQLTLQELLEEARKQEHLAAKSSSLERHHDL